jgi:polar amino acid transport system substrate-binding protein
MRWLLLINLLAVVLLSGAVAIVIEGTPVGTGPHSTPAEASDDINPVLESVQEGTSADDPITASDSDVLQPADLVNNPTAISEPETREVEAPSHIGEDLGELTVLDSDAGLVAAPDAPIPLPAPRTIETETVAAEPTAVEEPALAETGDEQGAGETLAPLVIATEGAFAPFNYVDGDGRPAGFDIDVAKELCRRLDRQCVFDVRPWSDLLPSLLRGDIDLIAASMRIPSTKPQGVLFTNPYYGSRGRFVTSKGAGIAGPGLLRVAGSQIAVQGGSVHEAYLQDQYAEVSLVKTRSLSEALQRVAEGKVEAAFGDNAAMLRWIEEQGCCTTLGNPITDGTFFGEGIGLVVQEEEKGLVDALNAQLQEMLEDGTSAQLSGRYFSGSIF